MNIFSVNERSQGVFSERDVLSVFTQSANPSQEIRHGMAPNEIAEIVSDRLIEVIKKQFEESKKEFQHREEK